MIPQSPNNSNNNHLNIQKKSESRIAAIEALYSIEISKWEKTTEEALKDITLYYKNYGKKTNNVDFNQKFLKTLLYKTLDNKEEIDQIIINNLSENWNYNRIGFVSRCILRIAVFEIKYTPQTPLKVIIDEYTNIAATFFDEKDIGFINGILDKIANNIGERKENKE